MALGRTHDRLNLISGAIICGFLLGIQIDYRLVVSLACGWLIATLILSPDLDVMPKKRSGVFLRLILFPYSIFFKHRGTSHSFLFGTMTRVLYGVLTFGLLIFVLNKMQLISYRADDYFQMLINFFKNFDYKILSCRLVVWFYAGMFAADIVHISLDHISSFSNRILKFLRIK